MSGHTPGKWASSEIAYSTHNRPDHFWEVTVYADSTPVADAVGNSQARAEANARLIAAAPKLLAALSEMLDRYVELVAPVDAGLWDAETEPQVIAARAAIAKATGATA